MDFLAKTIGGTISSLKGIGVPYTTADRINDPTDPDFPSIWSIHDSTAKSDGSKCTTFVFDVKTQGNMGRLPLAKNMASKLKTLRFPGVIKYLDSTETDTNVMIVTERVRPLSQVVTDMSQDTIIWGLHSLATTLKTINTDAKSIHGNINLSTVYVNESGEWVLGGFEVLTTTGHPDSAIARYGGLVPTSTRYSPPEIARSGWGGTANMPVHAIDSWQLGVFIYEAFNGVLQNPAAEMSQRRKVPAALWTAVRSLSNANPKQRLTSERFLSSQALKSDLVGLSAKLHGLSIVEEFVYNDFLDKLKEVESKFPRAYLHVQVLPELITCLEYGKGGTRTLTAIIQIAKDMPPDAYKAKVLPVILKMFASNDRAVRMELLQGLPEYIEYLDKRIVSDKIYPALSTGFTDTEPAIREQTVKAVLSIAPKLYDRQLNGDLLRQLAKTQNDSQQEIRANTTILLGKIAPLFSQSTRIAVLVTAFGRALKDPFVPSRLAALMALASTAEYFGPQETCGKILGTVAPSLIDKDRAVRNEAAKTMAIFMEKVNAHIASLENDPEEGEDVTGGAEGWGSWTATIAAGLSKKIASSNTGGDSSTANSSAAVSRTATPSRFEMPVRVPSRTDSSLSAARTVANKEQDNSWGASNGDDLWDQDGEINFSDDEPSAAAPAPVVKRTPLATAKKPTSFGATFGSSGGSSGSNTILKSRTAATTNKKPAVQKQPVEEEEDDGVDGWGDEWGDI